MLEGVRFLLVWGEDIKEDYLGEGVFELIFEE